MSLVVVRCLPKGDEYRCTSATGHLGQCGPTGTRDNEISPGKLHGHVAEERGHRGIKTMVHVLGADRVFVPDAGLMHNVPAAQGVCILCSKRHHG